MPLTLARSWRRRCFLLARCYGCRSIQLLFLRGLNSGNETRRPFTSSSRVGRTCDPALRPQQIRQIESCRRIDRDAQICDAARSIVEATSSAAAYTSVCCMLIVLAGTSAILGRPQFDQSSNASHAQLPSAHSAAACCPARHACSSRRCLAFIVGRATGNLHRRPVKSPAIPRRSAGNSTPLPRPHNSLSLMH